MPDNTFFRQPEVQGWLVDILMVWCKDEETGGKKLGYRQGLHELAAILLWVIWCDSIDPGSEAEDDDGNVSDDTMMNDVLDFTYVPHDTFAMFSGVMMHAKEWYEPGLEGPNGVSPIIQRSKYIHDTLLMATDPELATHLKALDVLPQVFLMSVPLLRVNKMLITGLDGGYACFSVGSFHYKSFYPFGMNCSPRIRSTTLLT